MKKVTILLMLGVFCFAHLPTKVDYVDGEPLNKTPLPSMADRVLISALGDIRGILGPQGKNIAVSDGAEAIAVIFGDPTNDVNNFMEVKIAYSLDDGANWLDYGPFSPEMRRIYPGVDGSPDFDVNSGELYFSWQESPNLYAEGDHRIMIEEGTPAGSSPSAPISLPNSSGPNLCPWFTCIAVNPDNPYYVISTSFSYLNNGNEHQYAWVSEDGGYNWSDTIEVYHAIDPIAGSSGAAHCRFGTGGYVMMTLHDTVNIAGTPIAHPFHIESTDGGYHWGEKDTLPVPRLMPSTQFWWTELDCEVINNEPWSVHNDINQTFPDSGEMWIFHGTGSPGAWTWDVTAASDYDVDTTVADTLYQFAARQYPSISYDPVSGIVLVSCKSIYLKVYVPTADTVINGAHIGGIFTTDNGASWKATVPLSEINTGQIAWADWSSTEVAHHLVNDNGIVYSYAVWVNETELNAYFEKGEIKSFIPGVEETNSNLVRLSFDLKPNVVSNVCCIAFHMPDPGTITLRVFDASGRLVKTVFEGSVDQGNRSFNFTTSNFATGSYFVVLETEHGCNARKLIKL